MKVKLLIANTCSVLKSLTNIIYMRCEQLTLRQRSEVTDLAHLKLLYPAADNELSKNWQIVEKLKWLSQGAKLLNNYLVIYLIKLSI